MHKKSPNRLTDSFWPKILGAFSGNIILPKIYKMITFNILLKPNVLLSCNQIRNSVGIEFDEVDPHTQMVITPIFTLRPKPFTVTVLIC